MKRVIYTAEACAIAVWVAAIASAIIDATTLGS